MLGGISFICLNTVRRVIDDVTFVSDDLQEVINRYDTREILANLKMGVGKVVGRILLTNLLTNCL